MKVLRNIRGFIQSIPSATISVLDWLVTVVERLIVLGVAGLAFYFGYLFFHGPLPTAESKLLDFLAQDWKIFLILLIPLFYKTIRTFLEEVQVAWGMSREKTTLDKSPSKVIPTLDASAQSTSSAPPEEE